MGAASNRPGKAPLRAESAESSWDAFKRWTGIEDPEADALLDAEPGAQPAAGRGPHWLPLALLFALYGFAVLVYIILGSRQPLPQVAPDEYQYSALARSVADGNGLTYNSGSIGIRWALYIYAISPAWLVTDSLTQAYAIAKAMSAFMVCAVVFPTWLLARRYMPPLVALVPAVLILAGSWMSSAGQLILENMAFPFAAASLAALVVALTRPGSRWVFISLGFAALATGARAQLAVLFLIVFLTLAVDIALQGAGWRERLRDRRWGAGVILAICVVGAFVVLADPSALGAYSELQAKSDLGRGLPLAGRQALAFIAMAAVLPFIFALAVSLRRRAWDETQLRPLLIVFWVGTITLVIVTGILTTAFDNVDWSIQRYVEYTLPLLYVVVVAGIWRGLIATRLVLLVTGLVAGVLLFTPGLQNIQEQRGVFGLLRRSDQLLGLSPGPTMALLALVVGLGTLLVVRLVRGPSTRATLLAVMVAFTGLVFAVQNEAGWTWQIKQARVWRDGFPKNMSWIDAATDEPLARIVVFYNPFRTPQTELFNRRITRTYVPATPVGGAPVNGFTCTWSADAEGAMTFDPKCGAQPTAFYLNDDLAKLTFVDQTVIAQKPGIGRVVKVDVKPPAKPALRAVVNPPCLSPIATQDLKTGGINPPRAICGGSAQGTLYLDKPATLVLRFRGGQNEQRVQTQGSWSQEQPLTTVPPRTTTDITLRAPAGAQQWQAAFDWQGAPPAVPALTSVLLKQGGTTAELLY